MITTEKYFTQRRIYELIVFRKKGNTKKYKAVTASRRKDDMISDLLKMFEHEDRFIITENGLKVYAK